MANYDTVIGLEIHVALLTDSKFLCSCSTAFGAPPNSQCCPVCLGLPGSLPTINEKAVECATKAGLALNCQINLFSKFDRKNYFYPDLPKAYQITQDAYPSAAGGSWIIMLTINWFEQKSPVFTWKRKQVSSSIVVRALSAPITPW